MRGLNGLILIGALCAVSACATAGRAVIGTAATAGSVAISTAGTVGNITTSAAASAASTGASEGARLGMRGGMALTRAGIRAALRNRGTEAPDPTLLAELTESTLGQPATEIAISDITETGDRIDYRATLAGAPTRNCYVVLYDDTVSDAFCR